MQTVSDIMTRGVRTMAPTDSLTFAAQAMRELNVGSLPVCDRNRLVGLVTDRDIVVRALAEERAHARIGDVMTEEPLYCFEDEPLEQALTTMRGQQIRRMPVVDRDKRLVGIVAMADVATGADVQQGADALRAISEPAAPDRSSQSAAAGPAGGGQTD
ncbi:CBS domain-containing protein [Paracidovorax wautersii]|uniref:CBS domain-containing protein n=1 Tax=Paracidovorax wautersii TaxID=1177982 RepID=A0ABU1IFB9_9BURK|nr:CBS domain-containing protein [Paracidovorax wautersii]MDR6214959.1 CBS domain-containing protein [Paracidovorax wautersii]